MVLRKVSPFSLGQMLAVHKCGHFPPATRNGVDPFGPQFNPNPRKCPGPNCRRHLVQTAWRRSRSPPGLGCEGPRPEGPGSEGEGVLFLARGVAPLGDLS